MRFRRQILALALILPVWPATAASAAAEDKQQNYDIDMIVTMSGRCSRLNIAGRDLQCRAVKYFHSRAGRAYFTIAIDDPADSGHIVSFSGENARRDGDRPYELAVDQMLLNSKERPKVEGLRVPQVEPSSGACKQFGTLVTGKVTGISCTATDNNGRKYELQFDSDDKPMMLQRISQGPLLSEKRRTRLKALFECRRKAVDANVLPRDSASYVIQCLEESGVSPAPDDKQ
jgi:hypothetical protein